MSGKSLRALAKEAGINRSTLAVRMRTGMSLDEALNKPVRGVDLEKAIGAVSGQLTIQRLAGHCPNGRIVWNCSCACGSRDIIVSDSVFRRGGNPSCGCSRGVSRTTAGIKNRAASAIYEVRGVRYTLRSLAESFSISLGTLSKRIKKLAWTPEAAVTIQVGRRPLSAASLALIGASRQLELPLEPPPVVPGPVVENPAAPVPACAVVTPHPAAPRARVVAPVWRPVLSTPRPAAAPVPLLQALADHEVSSRQDIMRCAAFNAKLRVSVCLDRQAAAVGRPAHGSRGRAANEARQAVNKFVMCADCPQGRRIAERIETVESEAAE